MKTLAITGLSVLIGLLFAFGLTRSNEGPPELPDVPIQAGPGGTSAVAALPATKALEREVGGERALVGSGALLRVVDENGAPIADAVLAIQRGASHAPGVAVEQVAADAEGRIDLGALAPGGNWLVGAPDFDWSAVDAGDREVVLERLPLARIEAVDVFGSGSFAGKRVRWLGDPALTRLFPWMETIGAWRVMGAGALEWGRLPRFGLDSYVGFDWELDARCTMVFAGLDVERLIEDQVGRVSEVAYRLELRRHSGHAQPRLVFLDADGAPREAAQVRLWCNGVFVRDAFTDAEGVVPIDFHMADEAEVAADLRIELLVPGAEPMVAIGDLDALREAGEWVFDGSSRTLDVRVETQFPLEFSVAHSALHQGGAEAPHLMDKAEAYAHLKQESLHFEALDAEGRATITSRSLANSHCVVLRHDASGLLVMGLCGLYAAHPVVFEAPQLCDLTAVPSQASASNWRVQLTGKSSQFGGSFLIDTGEPQALTPGRQTLRLPFGRYFVQLRSAHDWLEERSLYLEQAQQELPVDIPKLRRVQAQITRNFPDGGFPDQVVLQRRTDQRELQLVDREGRFDVWVAEDMELSDMAIGVTLPGATYQGFWVKPKTVEPDTGQGARLVYHINEARLRVSVPRMAFAEVVEVTQFAGGFKQWGTQPIRGGQAVFDSPAGSVELSTNVKGAETIKPVQLVAGEELHVALQDLAVGAVRIESDLPLGAEVVMWFREVVPVPEGFDEEDFDTGRYFRTTLRVEPESFERQAYDFLVSPAEYRVDVRVKWAAADFDTIFAETRLSLEVRAGEVRVLRVNLLDKLLKNLAREAEGNPDLEQVLVELGG